MKAISKIFVAVLALVLMYFVVVDGMMTVFSLSQAVQYAFNFGAILIGLPACIIFLFSDLEKFCWS
jgi:hypothetical protein